MLGASLLEDWRYYDGVMVRHTRQGIGEMDVRPGLNFVYALMLDRLAAGSDQDALDVFDGWMTCTYDQAMEFIQRDAEAEKEERLMAARMAGMVG